MLQTVGKCPRQQQQKEKKRKERGAVSCFRRFSDTLSLEGHEGGNGCWPAKVQPDKKIKRSLLWLSIERIVLP